MQLAWLVWCVRRARRLIHTAVPVDNRWILQIQEERQRQFFNTRQARILKSVKVCSPVAVGVRHPTVLLPVDCGEWSTETIRMVLSHEMAHVERQDIFWQLMARTAASLYWINPLTWLALSRMRQERERACDDRVLLTGVSAVDYAAGLAEFAAVLSGRRFPFVGSLGMAEHLPLEDRVRSILDASVVREPASRRIRGLLLVVTTILVLVLGTLRPFGPAPMANADGPNSQEAVSSRESEKSESQDADVSDVDPAPEAGEDAPRREPKQLPSKGSMQIRVVGLDGQPIAGAKLFANVSSYDRNATEWDKRWTIKNDNYVEAGTRRIRRNQIACKARGRPQAVEPGKEDPVVPAMFAIWWPEHDPKLTTLPDEFTYHLHKGTILGGIVKNDEGQPIQGVKVEARYSGKGIQSGEKTRAVFDAWLSEDDSALTTDAAGRWRLDNVPPGDEVEVYLKLSHPDYIKDRDWGQLQKGSIRHDEEHACRDRGRRHASWSGHYGDRHRLGRPTSQGCRRSLGRSSLLGRRQSGSTHRRKRCVSFSAAAARTNARDGHLTVGCRIEPKLKLLQVIPPSTSR